MSNKTHPPISKSQFIYFINFIKERADAMDKINEVFTDEFEDSIFYPYFKYEAKLVELLQIIMRDTDSEWISYFIYEKEFGDNYKDGDVSEADGTAIPMGTAGELYDFLCSEYEEKGSPRFILNNALNNINPTQSRKKSEIEVLSTEYLDFVTKICDDDGGFDDETILYKWEGKDLEWGLLLSNLHSKLLKICAELSVNYIDYDADFETYYTNFKYKDKIYSMRTIIGQGAVTDIHVGEEPNFAVIDIENYLNQ